MRTPLPIVLFPDAILRRPAEEIPEIDDEVVALGEAMVESMIVHEGIGLAGPQVGVGRRIIVVSETGLAQDARVLVNPRIASFDGEDVAYEEGCLSFPGIRGMVVRPARVTVESLDLDGRERRFEADELLARVLQHEIDHLDGILFVTKFGPADRLRARRRLRQLEKDHQAAAGRR
jgi:peptide deformylase